MSAEPLDARVAEAELAAAAELSPAERLREAISWNRVASELALAGEQARRAGHPATRSHA